VLCSTFKAERDAAFGGLEKVPKTQKENLTKRKAHKKTSIQKEHRMNKNQRELLLFFGKIENERGVFL